MATALFVWAAGVFLCSLAIFVVKTERQGEEKQTLIQRWVAEDAWDGRNPNHTWFAAFTMVAAWPIVFILGIVLLIFRGSRA